MKLTISDGSRPNAVMRQLHEDLSEDLERIAKRFKCPKITLIVRNPEWANGDVVLTDDDLNMAVASIRLLQERNKYNLE